MAEQIKQTGEIQNPYKTQQYGFTEKEADYASGKEVGWDEGYDVARSSVSQEIFKELEREFYISCEESDGTFSHSWVVNSPKYCKIKARYIKGEKDENL